MSGGLKVPNAPAKPVKLAYAPTPLDDEPLDGYLEHVAYGLSRAPGTIHRLLGMPNKRPYSIVRYLDPSQAATLANALDIEDARLRAMTLQRYERLGLMPSFDKRGHGTGTWPRGSGARYCPDCLRERGLRWKLSWYLQWTFVCTRHEQLLSQDCPRCGTPVRSRARGHPVRDDPTPVHANRPCDCATTDLANLSEAIGELPAAVLIAQEVISGVIHGGATPVTAFGGFRSRMEWLHDLAALTRLLMTHLPSDHIPAAYEQVLSAPHMSETLDALVGWQSELVCNRQHQRAKQPPATGQDVSNLLTSWEPRLKLQPTRSAGVRLRDATASVPAIALTASSAAIILISPDTAAASQLLQVLPVEARVQAVNDARRRGLSWPLIQVLDLPSTAPRGRSARGRVMRIQATRYRNDGAKRPPLDPAKIPSRIWNTFASAYPEQLHSGYAAIAASVALLSLGTDLSTRQACQRLGVDHLGSMIESELTQVLGLASGPHEDGNTELFDDLVRLHDCLASSSVPIDYQRRRRTFVDPQPPAERTSKRIARELGLRPTPRLRRFMGWWIFELLTGSDVLLGPHHQHVHGAHRAGYAKQRQEWEADPPPTLMRRAEHALLVNRLDEPLMWAPRCGRDDEWTCPPPRLERQLDWSNRPGREASRANGAEVDGLGMQEAVAFAASAQSAAAIRLAVKMSRFATVLDVGAITSAARSIGLKQATISSSMTALERDLGVTLIDRHGHGSTPTRAGRHLYRLIGTGPIRQVDPSTRMSELGRGAAPPREDPERVLDEAESAS